MYALAAHAPGLGPKTVLLSADYVPVSVQRFLEELELPGLYALGYDGKLVTAAAYSGGRGAGYHLRDRTF